VKTEEREEARRLRRDEGRSVREIQQLLGVSKSSVSSWVRDIELAPEQVEALRQRNPRYNAQLNGSHANVARALSRRAKYQEDGRLLARLGRREYIAGCMLFWAEGSRCGNSLQLTNSDPELIRFFVHFLRRQLGVPDEKIRVACNLFADHEERQHEIEQFWLDVVALPRSALTKTMVNRYSKWSQKKRKNKLPYGTCRVSIHDTRLEHLLYGSIQELAAFERDEWLTLRP
jgi:transcriptional regulator with XRE-family HTH domain